MASTPMRHGRIEEGVMAQARAAVGQPDAEEAQLLRAGMYALTLLSDLDRRACMALAKRRSGWPAAAVGGEVKAKAKPAAGPDCPSCRGKLQWSDDAWVCTECGDEWGPELIAVAGEAG